MFRPEVCDCLAFYVYRLVDPRDRRTFYVGKGTGNRVFAHVAGELHRGEPELLSPKLDLIASIRAQGYEVEHYIHRHGLDQATALHVEAALIDAYPNLTNAVRGHGADLLGNCRTDDLVARYQAEPAVWADRMLLVGIRKTGGQRSTYDAARYAWPLSLRSLRGVKYVLAVKDRLIVDAFEPTAWLPATIENFPDAPAARPERWGFVGIPAPATIVERYRRKRLPDDCVLSQVGVRYVGEPGAT